MSNSMFISPCTLGTDSHCSWPFPMMVVVTTNTFDNQVIVIVTTDFGSENCGNLYVISMGLVGGK